MGKILVLQHHRAEALGLIAEALSGAALAWQYVRPFEGQPVPAGIGAGAGLVVLGGPMGVYEAERFRFLAAEMRLIEDALKHNRPVLGVCLGSQLLAAVLGARVSKGPAPEIGWHPVSLVQPAAAGDALFGALPQSFAPLHWHGDVFDMPAGAVRLAFSRQTATQAFRYGARAYGLLFHLETTAAMLSRMALEFADEVAGAGLSGSELVGEAEGRLAALASLAAAAFGKWAEMAHLR